jgi:VanZ family protein
VQFVTRRLPAVLFAAAVLAMSGPWGASENTRGVVSPFFLGIGLSPAVVQAIHAFLRKLGHAAAYGVFALLARRAVAGARPATRADAWIAFALSVALASTDEGIQWFTNGRGASVADVLLDAAGAGGALLLAASFAARRRAAAAARAAVTASSAARG